MNSSDALVLTVIATSNFFRARSRCFCVSARAAAAILRSSRMYALIFQQENGQIIFSIYFMNVYLRVRARHKVELLPFSRPNRRSTLSLGKCLRRLLVRPHFSPLRVRPRAAEALGSKSPVAGSKTAPPSPRMNSLQH